MSISRRITIRLLLVFVLIPLFNYVIWTSHRQRFEEMLLEQALSVGRLLAPATKNALLATDVTFLQSILHETVANRDIVYGVIVDSRNTIIAHSDSRFVAATLSDPVSMTASAATATLTQTYRYAALGMTFLDVAHPLVVNSQKAATLRLGLVIAEGRSEAEVRVAAERLARILAVVCEAAVKNGDRPRIQRLLDDTIRRENVVYGFVVDADNRVIAHSNEKFTGLRLADGTIATLANATEHIAKPYRDQALGVQVIDVLVTLTSPAGERLGVLRLGLSFDRLSSLARRTGLLVGAMTTALMLVVLLVSASISRRITRPIKRLMADAALIATGRFNKPVDISTEDEIGLLAYAFEKMRLSVQRRVRDIATRAMGLEGELEFFSLPDLVQMIATSKRFGTLCFHHNGKEGLVVMDGATVLHAEADGERGESAFKKLYGWRTGKFKFLPNAPAGDRTIDRDWQSLVIEAARHAQETAQVMKAFPSLSTRVRALGPPDDRTSMWLTMDELRVSLLIEGEMTLSQVMASADLDEPTTRSILYRLSVAGFVEPVVEADAAR
ncbi:MAG: DUF4388 domain-containing protein [Candidatus Schekmanbacteria bacterium]|nr:DUF4388 domain-containing protein [Candidatus Schekmanbacteria bacterium]